LWRCILISIGPTLLLKNTKRSFDLIYIGKSHSALNPENLLIGKRLVQPSITMLRIKGTRKERFILQYAPTSFLNKSCSSCLTFDENKTFMQSIGNISPIFFHNLVDYCAAKGFIKSKAAYYRIQFCHAIRKIKRALFPHYSFRSVSLNSSVFFRLNLIPLIIAQTIPIIQQIGNLKYA